MRLRPLTRLFSLCFHPALSRRLEGNNIGAEGASALAAVLKETKIAELKCAAAARVCVCFHVNAR